MAVWRKSFSVPLMCCWQIERLFLCRTEFLLTDRNRTDLRICHLHPTDTSKALQFYRAPLLMFAYSIGEHQQGSAISDLDESRHGERGQMSATSHNIQNVARKKISQQGGQTYATCCAQQCCKMLVEMLQAFGQALTCKIRPFKCPTGV